MPEEKKTTEEDKNISEKDKDDKLKDDKTSEEGDGESSSDSKDSKSRYRIVWIAASSVLIAIILFLGVAGFGFYKLGWENNFILSVAKTLRLPVALYDSKAISYNDFQSDIDTLKFFYNAQASSNPGLVVVPPDSFLKKSVLSRLIRERFLTESADELGVTVSQADIDNEFKSLSSLEESEGAVQKTLQELYNWTEEEFKKKVLEPFLFRAKLQEYIAADEVINAEAKKQAEEALALIRAGEREFEDIAKEYSQDTTAASGGDLGYFSTGQMVPEFEEAAFALAIGETSGIVKTQFGYHIILLTERIEGTDESPEQLRASHILIQSKDVDEWINEQLANKKVSVLLSELEWKDDCGLVLGVNETCDQNELLDVASSQVGGAAPLNTIE